MTKIKLFKIALWLSILFGLTGLLFKVFEVDFFSEVSLIALLFNFLLAVVAIMLLVESRTIPLINKALWMLWLITMPAVSALFLYPHIARPKRRRMIDNGSLFFKS